MRNSAARDAERILGRAAGIDGIALEDDRLMTHSRDRERSREPGDAASGDDEPHAANVPGRSGTRQARRVLLCAIRGSLKRWPELSNRAIAMRHDRVRRMRELLAGGR
jgi:hypothetical protein